VIGRAVWREIEVLRADEPLRLVVRRDPARVIEVAVDDPGIHDNVNLDHRPVRPQGDGGTEEDG
jgi:CTP:molybdopterin cytidylyltransferase MocA